MSTPILTIFNCKSGVGKTSLVYHLSWMLAHTGVRVVALDLDPQARLTAAFLDEEQREELYTTSVSPTTISRIIEPLKTHGDSLEPVPFSIAERLALIPCDIALAGFEETLTDAWFQSIRESNLRKAAFFLRPLQILSAFWQIAQTGARLAEADIVLIDLGPNLGAINRSALIASDFIVIPLGADLFSLQALQNLGPILRGWREAWSKRSGAWIETFDPDIQLPTGSMEPLGYTVQQPSLRLTRPVSVNDRWVNQMPGLYHTSILKAPSCDLTLSADPECLAILKHYRSSASLSQEYHKPIFNLNPADGAIGSHAVAVRDAYNDYHQLADRILTRIRSSGVPGTEQLELHSWSSQ